MPGGSLPEGGRVGGRVRACELGAGGGGGKRGRSPHNNGVNEVNVTMDAAAPWSHCAADPAIDTSSCCRHHPTCCTLLSFSATPIANNIQNHDKPQRHKT